MAAASVVGLIVGTVAVARLSATRSSARPTAAAASPPATTSSQPQQTSAPTGSTAATKPRPSAATQSFAAVAGRYLGSTGSSGQLFIRSDGASRFTGLDFTACPTCSTATAPTDTIDVSLKTLVLLKRLGAYQAVGYVTASSDPADALKLAGPVGAKVTLTVGPDGSLRLGFLPATDVLRKAAPG